MLGAAPDQRIAHLLALIEQAERLKALEAPLDQLARLAFALLLGVQPVDDQDQALVAALRAGDEPVAGLLDEAGLKTVHPELGLEDQRVAVSEHEFIAILELGLPEKMIVLGVVVNQIAGEHGELAHRHQMTVRWEPGRIHESRLGKADLSRVFVHLLGEGFLAARDALRENDRGVVPRLNGDTLNQVGNSDLRVERREHGGGA